MMKKYKKYKPSKIEWIGEIPEHWEERKISRIFNEISGNGFPAQFQGKENGEYPFFKVSDINKEETYVSEANNYVNTSDITANKWKIIPKTSILLAKIGEALRKNHRKINTVDCLIDNNMIALKCKIGENKFWYYLLKRIDTEWFINPGAVPSINMESFRSCFIVFPPLPEQQAIASFLDDKTAKIDTLIDKKQKMIDLLKDERTAVINQAVTKGINPNVKMKPSGIDWLGEIPEHWDVRKLKYLLNLVNDKRCEDDIDFLIAVENIESGTGKIVNINPDKKYEGDLRKFEKEDVLFNKLRPYLAKVYLAEKKGFCVGELLIFRAKDIILPKYLFYRVFSRDFITEVNSSTYGSKMPRASWEDFISHLRIPYPKLQEQQQIVSYLETQTNRIDITIKKIEKEIELLHEYRQALISEAVTGKICLNCDFQD